MKRVSTGIADRIRQLSAVAGSQRRLAHLVGVSGPAVVGWVSGSVPYDSTLQRIAERTGVALEWLRDGVGDDEGEISSFRRRLTLAEVGGESARVAESPSDMECPIFQETPARGADRVLELAAERLNSAGVAQLIQDVLNDRAQTQAEKNLLAKRLTAVLAKKLAAEGAAPIRKN